MKFDFDEMIDRHGSCSMEYDWTPEMYQEVGWGDVPKDLIAIEVADMDFRCPPCIKEHLQKVVDFNLYGYCSLHPKMDTQYFTAIADWNKSRYGWEVNPEEIFYSAGTLKGITICLKALTVPQDQVLLLTPVYTPFYRVIRRAGRQVVKSPLKNIDGYYTLDWENFETMTADLKTTALVLCSPHNPVGRVWTAEELKRIHDICQKNGVIIIADEIHGDLTRKEIRFEPICKVTNGKGIAVCSGANKAFNIASLQASHIIVQDEELREKVKAEVGMMSATPFVIEAVIAAYTEGAEWLDQLRDYLDGNIDAVIGFLKEKMPKVKVWRPEGTYLLWMDFSAYGLTDDEIFDLCIHKAGVAIEQGREFDEGGHPGYVRICTSTQRARLMEAMERISKQF